MSEKKLRTVSVEHEGKTYNLKVRTITPFMVKQAAEAASVEGFNKFGKPLPLTTVMELELVKEAIKGGLNKNPAVWWVQNEDFALAKKIDKAIGMTEAMKLVLQDKDNVPEEKKKAKN